MNPRSLGYRLLGRGFDYLLHLRPAEWPIMAVHFLTGSALALGLAGILDGSGGSALWLGTIAFVVGINGGTLALNSAFDRDEGDVAYLRKPPPPPCHSSAARTLSSTVSHPKVWTRWNVRRSPRRAR